MVDHSCQLQVVFEVLCVGVKYSLHSTLALNSLHSPFAFTLRPLLRVHKDVVDEPCGSLKVNA